MTYDPNVKLEKKSYNSRITPIYFEPFIYRIINNLKMSATKTLKSLQAEVNALIDKNNHLESMLEEEKLRYVTMKLEKTEIINIQSDV